MQLVERVLNDHLYLLTIMIITIIIISYSIKNRPILLKSIVLAHLKKTDFKFVLNNTQDRIVTILFWNSILLQALALCFVFEETNISPTIVLIVFITLVIIKRGLITISGFFFQKKKTLRNLPCIFYNNGNTNRLGLGIIFFIQDNLSQ